MRRLSLVFLAVLGLCGCAMMSSPKVSTPVPLASTVDLPKFMGDWYVIAAIPLWGEREAYNAIESYSLKPDGTVMTNFRERKGGFDAPVKTYHPHGFPLAEKGNAEWGMRIVWPFKSQYKIAFVEPDYSATIIARDKRDYVWLMARTPQISADAYARYEKMIADMGYDVAKIRKVPQQWPEK
jgi:apolipoprotein D and lipocalin family protein